MEKYYLVPIFYIVVLMIYRYSKGKYKVREGKEEQYKYWVNTSGKRISKSVIILTIIYTVGMVIQIFMDFRK